MRVAEALRFYGDVQHVVATAGAFVAIKTNGCVVSWGDPNAGGNSAMVQEALSSNVLQVVGSAGAFAAVKTNGSVVTWGKRRGGGNSANVQEAVETNIAHCKHGAQFH